MQVFNLSCFTTAKNKAYWHRELGSCWEQLVIELFRTHCQNFQPAITEGNKQFCDLVINNYAIDTKYRVGTGDSGFVRKFTDYSIELRSRGFKPVMLILREDNLKATINSFRAAGWEVYVGEDCFDFIEMMAGFNLKSYLQALRGGFIYDENTETLVETSDSIYELGSRSET